jgi:hypothetical protein
MAGRRTSGSVVVFAQVSARGIRVATHEHQKTRIRASNAAFAVSQL